MNLIFTYNLSTVHYKKMNELSSLEHGCNCAQLVGYFLDTVLLCHDTFQFRSVENEQQTNQWQKLQRDIRSNCEERIDRVLNSRSTARILWVMSVLFAGEIIFQVVVKCWHIFGCNSPHYECFSCKYEEINQD